MEAALQTSETTKRSTTRLTTAFTKAYDQLNEAQKKAVETIEGPVMVIAGPGTGKTQTLAVRIANILRKTQMQPSNILCLTYSNTGVKAMRERLRQIIGPDAYGVTVETVHSFCNGIILQHPHLFEDFSALEQVSEIERLRIIRSLMHKLGAGSILGKLSPEHDRAYEILGRITEMKREGVSPSDLTKLVPEYRKEISLTDSGKERDQSTQAYKDGLRRVKQLEEFSTLYQGYNKELQKSHRYDYEDMVLVCNAVLAKHDWLLADLQVRYQYILVDELQDLNGTQNKLIEILTTSHIKGEEPNLFVVGDDDQAIHRFQGAEMKNMLLFLERFSSSEIIAITRNYRSLQPILDAASTLIAQNQQRLVNAIPNVEKKLQSTFSAASERPQFLRYPSTETEHAGIMQILREAHNQATPWTEMAILCRSNAELSEIFDVLCTAGIPAVLTAKQDLLLQNEVLQTIALLRSIENPDDTVHLSTALGCRTLHCHPADLGRVWCALREMNQSGKKRSLRSFLLAELSSLPPSLATAVELIESLHAERGSITLPQLLEHTLKKSGLLPSGKDTEANPLVIAALHRFFEYVRDRAYESKSLTLSTLLHDLEDFLREKHLKLEYDVPHLTTDGVQLMTAHKSKGLEFDLVIVPHVRYGNWGNRRQGKGIALPDHLILDIDKEEEKSAKQEDERRLLYVAMTRAKRKMILTFAETYRSGENLRDAQVSSFIADTGEEIQEIIVPPEEVPEPLETLRKPALAIDDAFRAFLEEKLETFALSASSLEVFLQDPLQFLWICLLEQPQARDQTYAFGNAVHHVLAKWGNAIQMGTPINAEQFMEEFHNHIENREVLTAHERADIQHKGNTVLKKYYEDVLAKSTPLISKVEFDLRAEMSGIPLKGRMDRMDLFHKDGKNCRIIDYKTGATKKTEATIRKDERLFRQLVFYKLLSDLSPSFTHEATIFTLDFIGNEKDPRRVHDFEISNAEAQELKELIKIVWGKIVAMDFTPL